MSLVPQSPNEIIKDYGDRLAVDFGPNVLQDPTANRGSNLVRLAAMTALSLSDIQHGVEATIVSQNPNNLEGVALTNYAAQRGVQRKTGTKSKAVAVVTGQQGSTLTAGSQLRDRYGSVWNVTADITLDSVGIGCAFGTGVVCSDVAGSFLLDDGELVFDNATIPFIFAATNGQMLEVGGQEESDEALRNRLLSRGPLSNVIGSKDNAIANVAAIDGVEFVRYEFVDTCIGEGPMMVVYGGNPQLICDTILKTSGVVCNLVGETSCGSCNSVRFQRPCPVLLCIEVTINCDCPLLTQEQIASIIMSQAPAIARQTKVRAADIANLQEDIDSVRFSIKSPMLASCPDADDIPTFNDPISNTPVKFATDNPYGLCGGKPDCGVDENTFVNSVTINPYQYFIMDQSVITFVNATKPESECITDCTAE